MLELKLLEFGLLESNIWMKPVLALCKKCQNVGVCMCVHVWAKVPNTLEN